MDTLTHSESVTKSTTLEESDNDQTTDSTFRILEVMVILGLQEFRPLFLLVLDLSSLFRYLFPDRQLHHHPRQEKEDQFIRLQCHQAKALRDHVLNHDITPLTA